LLFRRERGVAFSHKALVSVRDVPRPKRPHADARALVGQVFESVPIGQSNAMGITEIIAKLDSRRTKEHMHQVLKKLVQRQLIVLTNGRSRYLFHRAPGVAFSEAALNVVATGSSNPAARKVMGQDSRTLKDATGKMYGADLDAAAKEGQITEVSYMFPKPGTDTTPVAKVSFVTKVGDLGRGVGYYK